MTTPISPGKAASTNSPSPHEKLKTASRMMEAQFLSQLFAAMRASATSLNGGQTSSEEKLFTQMMDDRISELAALRSQRGLGDALYRQLSRHLPPENTP